MILLTGWSQMHHSPPSLGVPCSAVLGAGSKEGQSFLTPAKPPGDTGSSQSIPPALGQSLCEPQS